MSDGSHDTRDAMTVTEAAGLLGISEGAVRKRVERGKLEHKRTPDGRLIVYLDSATDTTHDRPRQSRDTSDRSRAMDQGEVVDLLRAQLQDLRADRDAWRDQARRSDYMASAAMDRTRELESRLRELEAPAPAEARESPVAEATEPEGASPRSDTPTPQQDTQRPSNLARDLRDLGRRIFGR